MTPQIKNILMFVGIAGALLLVYFYFIKGDPEADLVVTTTIPGGPLGVSGPGIVSDPGLAGSPSAITGEFLSVLLNIQNLKLNDTIFSDPAFMSLKDSSITLTPDPDEGRPNPFAPVETNRAVNTETSQTTGAPGF